MSGMKLLAYSLLTSQHLKQSLKHLRQLEYRLPSARSRFAIPFVYRGRGHFKSIRPRQTPTEIEDAYSAVLAIHPHRVLEIGTARGGTLYLWTQAATEDAVLVSVDLPGGDFGGGYPSCRVPFYQAFAQRDQKLHLLRADSHEPAIVQQVAGLFEGEPIDFCFIDGDHRYEGVKADFLNFAPMVRPGGLIGFHDILPAEHDPDIEVNQLWRQIKPRFEAQEFVGVDHGGRVIGIGLIRVPEQGFPNDLVLD